MALRNTPAGQTILRLEASKSFAFGVRLKDPEGEPVDITGCTFSIVAKAEPLVDSDTADDLNILTNTAGEIVDAATGHVRFNLQASDLAHPPGEYPFVIVMLTAAGYSVVLVKGVIDLVENPEHASTASTYSGITPLAALDVLLQDLVSISVVIGGILPPGMQFISDEDKTKLDSIQVQSSGIEVDLSSYATKAYADAVSEAAKAAAQAYVESWAAAVAHTHRFIDLAGTARGTAAPSGGVDGDVYLQYIAP